MENLTALPKGALSPQKLQTFFINNLNRIYCAKSHLQERLSEIRGQVHFSDLNHAISETLDNVNMQISRMDQIFALLAVEPAFEKCQGVVGLIEDLFSAIIEESHDPVMRDLSILLYLQNIESVEAASFKMLKSVASEVNKKEIRQLLQENYDEANEDLALLQSIAAKYVKG